MKGRPGDDNTRRTKEFWRYPDPHNRKPGAEARDKTRRHRKHRRRERRKLRGE